MKTPAPVFSEHCGLLPATYCWCVDDDIYGDDNGECTQGTKRTWLPGQRVGSHCFVPGKSQPSLGALLSNWQTDQRGEMPKVYSVLFQTRRPKWYRSLEKLPSNNKSCKFFKVNITKPGWQNLAAFRREQKWQ